MFSKQKQAKGVASIRATAGICMMVLVGLGSRLD
jgi:hypothetical protein